MGQVIHDSGKRLERLIENFLIYAQIELMSADSQQVATLRMEQTRGAAGLIEERARDQARLAKRENDLVLALNDVPVPMSEEYLGKVVDELAQNGFKFSDPGRPVRVELKPTGRSVTLSVTDQGRGFSTEHIRRIGAYMQFGRKLHEQQGLGLGLTIAKRLAELFGGTLAIESQPGVTTTVLVRLPEAVNPAQKAPS
jgi:signal transduction histidine kinase